MRDGFEIEAIRAAVCTLTEAPWPFAVMEADAIDRHWERRLAQAPDMFDGRVLVLRGGAVEHDPKGAMFRGECLEVSFKAFLAWREFGFPGRGIRNCFAMAALESVDGAFLLGEMASHNATAGQIYFPSGTPDRDDVNGHIVDLDGSARRELLEETGLGIDDVHILPGFDLVSDDSRACIMKQVHSPLEAETLQRRIETWLSCQDKPELARMHVVRRVTDLTAAVPAFVASYIASRLET